LGWIHGPINSLDIYGKGGYDWKKSDTNQILFEITCYHWRGSDAGKAVETGAVFWIKVHDMK
jgi:hypothetical protein